MAKGHQGKQPSGSNVAGSVNDEEGAVTQAIVICNKDSHRFYPLTLDTAKALLPIGNVSMIDFTLEMLSKAGIKEVFLVCNSFAEQYREFLRNSHWSKHSCGMIVKVLVTSGDSSVGDSLREIDEKGIIHNDFILVNADLVGNVELSNIIELHRQRRKQDKNVTMTILLKRIQPSHYARPRNECAVYTLNDHSHELLNYFLVESEYNTFSVPIQSELLKKHSSVSLHYDLVDCQLDICSTEVLSLFTENFDYQDVRKDFVRGILTSDIIPNKFHCHIIDSDYCNRVSSPYMYDVISRDFIKRWLFPITPEMNPFLKVNSLAYAVAGKNNVYLGQNVLFDRSSHVESNSIIGHYSEIHKNTRIIDSVIGSNVFIGSNCLIEGCYVMDGCRIEDGCIIYRSFISNNCTLYSHTQVQRGCLIGANCCIGPEVKIPPLLKITSFSGNLDEVFHGMSISSFKDGNDESSIQDKIWKSQDVLGSDANCYIWDKNEEDFSEFDAEYLDDSKNLGEILESTCLSSTYRANFRSIFNENYKKYLDNLEYSCDESDESLLSENESNYSKSPPDSIQSFSPINTSIQSSKSIEIFTTNIIDMVKNAVQSDYTIDNTALEINALKFACNSSFKDCRNAIIPALCSFIDPSNFNQSCNEIFDKWGKLLQKFVHTSSDQIDAIVSLQNCLSGTSTSKAFSHIILILYNMCVLEDECIISWYNEKGAGEYHSQVQPFIQWLQMSGSEDEE